MKILYAANNSENSKLVLERFQFVMKNFDHQIKIAAYKHHSPNIHIDWTLDALHDMYHPNSLNLDNENLEIYYEQIKSYKPDLIISDVEYFTSYIANLLNIQLWQCSSSLINYALSQNDKYNSGIYKKYSFLYRRDKYKHQKESNLILNSNKKLVYSHFGDSTEPPILKDDYIWVRPYHLLGKQSIPCQHNIVAASLNNNKKLLSILKKYQDTVVFTNNYNEQYNNLILKDIANYKEYICNLYNCNITVCQGETIFLADYFYNNRYALILTNYEDVECVINSTYSEKFKLSSTITKLDNLEDFDFSIKSSYNNVKYLHELINEM